MSTVKFCSQIFSNFTFSLQKRNNINEKTQMPEAIALNWFTGSHTGYGPNNKVLQ